MLLYIASLALFIYLVVLVGFGNYPSLSSGRGGYVLQTDTPIAQRLVGHLDHYPTVRDQHGFPRWEIHPQLPPWETHVQIRGWGVGTARMRAPPLLPLHGR